MDDKTRYLIAEIQSKAEYIADVATGLLAGCEREPLPEWVAHRILQDLESIGDAIGEYHKWDDEEGENDEKDS